MVYTCMFCVQKQAWCTESYNGVHMHVWCTKPDLVYRIFYGVQNHVLMSRNICDVLKHVFHHTVQSLYNTMFRVHVCFIALRPKSTAMVMVGRSVHLTTLFSWASLNKRLTSNLCTYFHL